MAGFNIVTIDCPMAKKLYDYTSLTQVILSNVKVEQKEPGVGVIGDGVNSWAIPDEEDMEGEEEDEDVQEEEEEDEVKENQSGQQKGGGKIRNIMFYKAYC